MLAVTGDHIDSLNEELGQQSAENLIRWAHDRFDRGLVMTSSFGAHSAVMLHLVSRTAPGVPVIFIDTGYLFAETYRFAETLKRRLNLRLHVAAPSISAARQEALFGNLWEQGEDGVAEYLRINKVEPLQRALQDLRADAWMSGVRSTQTEHRAALKRIDVQDERIKIHPILGWTTEQIEAYLEEHELPFHPLYHEGYRSIGDTHSTLPTTADMDPRAGRLLGQKRECGIHLPMSAAQNQSLKSSGL